MRNGFRPSTVPKGPGWPGLAMYPAWQVVEPRLALTPLAVEDHMGRAVEARRTGPDPCPQVRCLKKEKETKSKAACFFFFCVCVCVFFLVFFLSFFFFFFWGGGLKRDTNSKATCLDRQLLFFPSTLPEKTSNSDLKKKQLGYLGVL